MALNTKTTAKKRSIQKKRSLSEFFTNRNRKIGIGLILALVAVGVYFLFFASAATNNCQAENGVQICDVDQTAGGGDSVLSLYGEAESLGNQGWGTYFGTAFRAPTTAYDGAVPVHRFLNPSASWHEFTTDAQLGQKEAAAGGRDKLNYEGIVFYAWTDGHRAGTVPVYRITRLGAETQSMFSTDKAWIDKMVAGPWGWQQDATMPGVAFYAYPPGYAVAQQVNPYDCSILENFTSPRCAKAAENLGKEIAAGNVPATSECPKDWASWNKALFPDKFEQACRDKWNGYAQNCSNPDVFQSDRCKKEREALIAANNKLIADKKAADAAAKKKQVAPKGGKGGGSGGGTTSATTLPARGSNGCLVGQSRSAREGCITTTPSTSTNTGNPCKDLKGRALANCQNSTKAAPGSAGSTVGSNGCPLGQSRSAREGCVSTTQSGGKFDSSTNPYVACEFWFQVENKFFIQNPLDKFYSIYRTEALPSSQPIYQIAASTCATKQKAYMNNNNIFEAHTFSSGKVEYQTKDWQHKKVKSMTSGTPIRKGDTLMSGKKY